jgi:hypothetical protein
MSLQSDNKQLILVGLIALAGEYFRARMARKKGEIAMEPTAKIKLGIKETDEVVGLLILLAKGIQASAADGKLDASDIGNLMPVIMACGPALEGISQIPAELMDLDSEEGAALVGKIAGELALPSEHAKEVLVAALQAAVVNYQLVKVILKK